MNCPIDAFSQPGFALAIVIVVVFELITKGFALWRAAKNNQKGWFIMLFVLNTAGALPLFYLFGIKKKSN